MFARYFWEINKINDNVNILFNQILAFLMMTVENGA